MILLHQIGQNPFDCKHSLSQMVIWFDQDNEGHHSNYFLSVFFVRSIILYSMEDV